MGRIRRISDETVFVLWSQTVIGRDPQCSLPLDRACVSALHARIFWDAERSGWVIEAFDTPNGTHFRRPPRGFTKMRAGARSRKALSTGDRLMLGEAVETWELEDDTAPFPEAQPASSSRRIPADGGVLRLPDSDDALVSIHYHPDQGTYVIEDVTLDEGEPRRLDSDVLEVGSDRYRLHFDVAQPTARPVRGDLRRGHLEYEPRGGAPGLVYVEGSVRLNLGTYACFGVVGKLAEARLADRSRGRDESEAGWRNRGDLHVRGDRDAATHELWRCQQQLRTTGLHGIEMLFEKRQRQGLVRLGVEVRLGRDQVPR